MECKREGKKTGIYRSKLEQAWARFFVDCGIPFIHEPKYYDNWLPDFELIDCRALLEIKPTVKIAREELKGKEEGLWLANQKHDIVVLVGRPKILEMDVEFGGSGPELDFVLTPPFLAHIHHCWKHFVLDGILGFAERGDSYLLGVKEEDWPDGLCENPTESESMEKRLRTELLMGADLVQCHQCHAYYFIGEQSNYSCRKCNYHAGTSTFYTPNFERSVLGKYLYT